jgi:glycosyltransferase involved in cell wall biosynthesis
MRVLIVSHEWEAMQPGGAQRSAVSLAQALSAVDEVEVTLASAVPRFPDGVQDGRLDARSGFDERLVVSRTDPTFFTWTDPALALGWEDVLTDVRPDVVHLHHYFHVGIDLPLLVRRLLPRAGVVLTLHEYLAICLRSGQMVDSEGELCSTSGVRRCSECVGWAVDTVAAREDYVRRGFKDVDVFVAPSVFARDRYQEWFSRGGQVADIRVVPNALSFPALDKRPPRRDGGIRLAYVGQHTPMKGVGVLLDAVSLLERERPGLIERVDIFGDGSDRFGPEFHAELSGALVSASPLVRTHGRYLQEDLPAILDAADAIVVPSTWWENSPVVIEEALARRVPVICSDIGGMAEKVRDSIDGWHFAVGSAASLAEVIERLARPRTPSFPQMRRPPSVGSVAREHQRAYEDAITRTAVADLLGRRWYDGGDLAVLSNDGDRTIYVSRAVGHVAQVHPIDADADAVRLTIGRATWLAGHGARVLAPVETEPLHLPDGRMVTVWPFGTASPTTSVDFAAIARSLHDSLDPGLPSWQLVDDVRERLDYWSGVDSAAPQLLSALRAWFEHVRATQPTMPSLVPVHSDAHPGNIVTVDGQGVLIDLDGLCLGPREFDLATWQVNGARGPFPPTDLDQLVDAYGPHLVDPVILAWFRDLCEINVLSWFLTDGRDRPDSGTALARWLATVAPTSGWWAYAPDAEGREGR